jgi:hypothetical protein
LYLGSYTATALAQNGKAALSVNVMYDGRPSVFSPKDAKMTASPNPLAPHHLPFFITAPGQTDVLMVVMLVMLLLIVLIVGNLYFKLHSLPEHMAHRNNSGQMQLVAVLTLLALATHNQIFWVAALLLVVVKLPDFSSPLNSIAQSLSRLAGAVEPTAVQAPSIPVALVAAEPRVDPARNKSGEEGETHA